MFYNNRQLYQCVLENFKMQSEDNDQIQKSIVYIIE